MEHLNNESADARISEWRRPAWAADRARQYILRRLVGHGADGRRHDEVLPRC
jgi:hypothetical protein